MYYALVYFSNIYEMLCSSCPGQKTSIDEAGVAGASKESTEAKIATTLKGSMGERVTKALAKVEEKKRKRAARKAEVE